MPSPRIANGPKHQPSSKSPAKRFGNFGYEGKAWNNWICLRFSFVFVFIFIFFYLFYFYIFIAKLLIVGIFIVSSELGVNFNFAGVTDFRDLFYLKKKQNNNNNKTWNSLFEFRSNLMRRFSLCGALFLFVLQ